MKICKLCGCSFEPAHTAQVICSNSHFSKCPVCGKTVEWNSRRPVKPCSRECSNKLRKQTVQSRLGVDNVMKSSAVRSRRTDNWAQKIHSELPFKLKPANTYPKFRIDDNDMSIYVLTEKASTTFLSSYGHNLGLTKFGKVHLSLGLVNDGILYQVLRFERKHNKIVLADFGTRFGFFNPDYYSKLLKFAVEVSGIDSFTAEIPRHIATAEVISSLSIEKISEKDYRPYWQTSNGNRFVTRRDNIAKMRKKLEYYTTDYIDIFEYKSLNKT